MAGNKLVHIEFKKENEKYDINLKASGVEYNTTISPQSSGIG